MNLNLVYKVKTESFVIRRVMDEMVLVPLVNNVADMTSVITLNDTAASIIEMLDGKSTLNEIFLKLLDTYNVKKELLERDMITFVADALKKGIIKLVA